jgi:hypothetical protein
MSQLHTFSSSLPLSRKPSRKWLQHSAYPSLSLWPAGNMGGSNSSRTIQIQLCTAAHGWQLSCSRNSLNSYTTVNML